MSLLPSPTALVELTRYAAGQVVETVASAATVPARVLGVLSQTELLVSRMSVLAERAESLIDRVERVTADAEETVGGAKALVQRVDQVTTEAGQIVQSAAVITAGAGQIVQKANAITADAEEVVQEAASTSKTAKGMLEEYVPTLQRAAPLLARFVNDLTPEEVTAAIKMIDTLPELRRHLTEDVMPLLGKLDQVGPDLHSLLEVTNDLHLAIVGMPGLKLLRRRGAERVAEENHADEK
ncbi:hypothetical protein [Winogradskya humida]|uniref:Ribulose 1,5-bisphosphate carboxylase large subunit n=1 Tax=Winogradskya humida TaxID=113566 RepID=A0ABQ3ZTH3_9ACTN|nr:hypothetical protein [Actinoplanes humidus]GIE21870.1 hypothetical protein Ahu01nite_049720 [Actinoplanes humidus]